MKISHFKLWTVLALTTTLWKWFVDAATTIDSASACLFDLSDAKKGFKVKYYDYYYNDQAIRTASYLASEYTTLPLISTATGVTDLHYSLGHSGVSPPNTAVSEIWGMSVRYPEYLFEFTGYYYPPVTGLYEFVIDFVDDSVIFYVGHGSFDCCTGETIPDNAGASYILFTIWTSDYDPDANSALVYLEEGYYIPLRIVQGNLGTAGGLQFEVYKPDGEVDPNFYDNVVAPIPGADCTATTIDIRPKTTITSGTKPPQTFTSTYTNSNGSPTQTGIVVIIPTPTYSTTTTTFSTYHTTLTHTFTDSTTTYTEIIVIVPTPSLSTTTITSGTEEPYTVTSTFTDSTTTYTEIIVIVPTPSLSTTTITSGTEEPYTVTSTFTDPNGNPTSTGVVVVDPTPSLSTTTITSGTEEPYTVTSTFTDPNGNPTSTGVVVVDPTPSLSTTTITSGTQPPYTVTSTFTDPNGNPTSTGVVVVDPTPSLSTTTITSGTEEPSTLTSTYTNANGSPTNTGVIVVLPTFSTITITSGNDVPSTVISTLTIKDTITTCIVVISPTHDDFTTVTIGSGSTPMLSSTTYTGSNGKLTTGVTIVEPSTEQEGLSGTATITDTEIGTISTNSVSGNGDLITSTSISPESSSTNIPQEEFNAANISYSLNPFTYLIPLVILVLF